MPAFNQAVFLWVHNFAGRNVIIDDLGILFADYLPYVLVLGFLVLASYRKGWRGKMYVFIEGALAVILADGIIAEAIRFFYHHPRPSAFYGFAPLVSFAGPSFPSAYMTALFALSLVAWYADRTWGTWYFILSAIIGIARIYGGASWPLDILGGIAIGLACGWLVHRLFAGGRRALEASNGSPAPEVIG